MAKILVIDDQRAIRNTLKDILECEGHTVVLADDGASGLEAFRAEADTFDIVLTDIRMPNMDGIEVLEQIMAVRRETPVIMISGHGDIDTAVDSIRKGAFDFIAKPLDLNRLLITIKNAIEKKDLVVETRQLKVKVQKTYEMVGESEPMRRMREMIDRVAPTDARVLILGENGTGKELVARALHENSSRARGPFVEVNCAAIPSELIESELFGHEKGAFTSAIRQRIGKFEQADGGTIFLDEIGDINKDVVDKYFTNTISRVGSDKDIRINVRVLAATNKNMADEIKNNRFREDLYHRLSVIIIQVPSLNSRKDDIPMLADYFLGIVRAELNVPNKTIAPEAVEALKQINWTGNIREFRNVIERLAILGGTEITAKDVADYARPIM